MWLCYLNVWLLSCELLQPCQQPLEEESEDNLFDLLRLVMDRPWTHVFDMKFQTRHNFNSNLVCPI